MAFSIIHKNKSELSLKINIFIKENSSYFIRFLLKKFYNNENYLLIYSRILTYQSSSSSCRILFLFLKFNAFERHNILNTRNYFIKDEK